MATGARVADPGMGQEVQEATGPAVGAVNQAGGPSAPVPAHGDHGRRTLTGAQRRGRSGGTVRHALAQTGLAGQRGPGAPTRRGRLGKGALRARLEPMS
jgi:hypothetical protein